MKRKLRLLFHWLFDAPNRPASSSGNKPRIAYITKGNFSFTNIRVLECLHRDFPEFEIERIDMAELLQENKLFALLNIFHTFRLYGWDLLSRRRLFRDCYYRTSYLFKAVKEKIRSRLEGGNYLFALQTQSLLDFSVPGIPNFVYTDHTHLTNLCYPAFDPDQLYPRWWIDLEREIYANAARVFVMTQHVKRSLVEDYGCEPSLVDCIYAGGNMWKFLEEAGPSEPVEREQRILFVGLEWERKGGPQLLEAFLSITDDFPEAKLVIVGSSPEVDHPNVEILGRVPLAEVRKQYLRAQIFGFPTRVEPSGLVVIEAMMHRLAVVGTPVGNIAEMVRPGENGVLVAVGDIPGTAAALADLLKDPEKCRRLGDNAYDSVSVDYTWTAVGPKLRKGIEETLEAQGLWPAFLDQAHRS